jgi:hypothetical protein
MNKVDLSLKKITNKMFTDIKLFLQLDLSYGSFLEFIEKIAVCISWYILLKETTMDYYNVSYTMRPSFSLTKIANDHHDSLGHIGNKILNVLQHNEKSMFPLLSANNLFFYGSNSQKGRALKVLSDLLVKMPIRLATKSNRPQNDSSLTTITAHHNQAFINHHKKLFAQYLKRAILKKDELRTAFILDLLDKTNSFHQINHTTHFGTPPQSFLDIALNGRLSNSIDEYESAPSPQNKNIILLLRGYQAIRRQFKTNEIVKAVKIIEQQYLTYSAYQKALEKEKNCRGSLIDATTADLDKILPGFYAFFLNIRLVGFSDTSELGLALPSFSPQYERLSNPFASPNRTFVYINSKQTATDKVNVIYKLGLNFLDSNSESKTYSDGDNLYPVDYTFSIHYGSLDLYPSLYQVLRHQHPVVQTWLEPLIVPHFQNFIAFQKIKKIQSNHLIYKFLIDALSPLPNIMQQDAFSLKITEKINAALEWIAFYDNLEIHYKRIMQLYIYIMALVRVAITYGNHYSILDYQKALDKIQSSRLNIDPLYLRHYPVKSGMDSILTAFIGERLQSVNSNLHILSIADPIHECKDCHPIYFELNRLLQAFVEKDNNLSKASASSKQIFVVGLTSEHQLNDFALSKNFNKSLAIIKKACSTLDTQHYVSVIIDQTISLSSEKDPVNAFIQAITPEIMAGKINVCVCKSFQKYSSLGTSAIKLGNITMINNRDSKFEPIKNHLDKADFYNFQESCDEIQIATFFLTHLSHNEFIFIEQASKNALHIKKTLYADNPDVFASGPFIHTHCHKNDFVIPCVVNFGFLNTTTVSWVSRINVGLEPARKKINSVLKADGENIPSRYQFNPNSFFKPQADSDYSCDDSNDINTTKMMAIDPSRRYDKNVKIMRDKLTDDEIVQTFSISDSDDNGENRYQPDFSGPDLNEARSGPQK